MSEFKREERYIVVKLKHLADLQQAPLRNFLRENRVPQIECVVVEHDWPEYHLVWAMIEHRMAGKPVPNFNDWRRADALQQLLNDRDQQLHDLEQRRRAEFDNGQAAERRADVLEGLLRDVRPSCHPKHIALIDAALKPAEPAKVEHICTGCGSKGWTANCAECVPY